MRRRVEPPRLTPVERASVEDAARARMLDALAEARACELLEAFTDATPPRRIGDGRRVETAARRALARWSRRDGES